MLIDFINKSSISSFGNKNNQYFINSKYLWQKERNSELKSKYTYLEKQFRQQKSENGKSETT